MKATTGAQGTVLASMDSTTAVVPQEHRGVATATPTEPATAPRRWRRSQPATWSVPI